MWIVKAGYQDLSRAWSDAENRANACDPRVVLADGLKLLDDGIELL